MIKKKSMVDFEFLENIEEEDSIFPNLQIRDWQK